ncbi:MAG: ornithine carbamoyltransferase [Nanoarchaeota archaeon]|nr:ornithine carbamoyltransferase [Nanoarchaeota archaeon]
MKHLLSLNDLSGKSILKIVKLGKKIKRRPNDYENKLRNKTLLMLFAKPSLRTRLSFDIAMYQLGGHAIFYDLSHSVLGKKESMKDFSKVISRYVNITMARLYEHKQIEELARYSTIPVINGLTNYFHPCQILGDLLTMKEKFGKLKNVKITYVGDGNNNVTHSLILGCKKLGMEIIICCPNKKEFLPNKDAIGNMRYSYEKVPSKAVKNASVIYTDSWMSYHIPKSQEKRRMKILRPYQVNKKLFDVNKKALFMHCLPATRGYEVTDDVIDSKRSIIYEQAENRIYVDKAVLLKLVGKAN